ncbi:MAG: alpha-ketoacid dehydrogenase subunit beta [Candidatus Aenigmarchaeota archaeon]|nr:alpha-ketoacid dehydrogenase subunit beta [Candidatus Aenigmarchaeota archaeon]
MKIKNNNISIRREADVGENLGSSSVMNLVQAINSALQNEMEADSNVIILGEDVGIDGGVFRVTDGLQKKFGEQRVVDTPLAESAIVGSAIGMSVYGLKPVAEIQFDGFMHTAFNQIVNHAARIRTRSRGRFHCPLVIRAPYSGGIKALEHHSDSPETYFAHTPGLKVVIPSNPYDAKGLMISAIRDPDPVIFLEPKRIYRAIKQEVPDESYTVPLEKCNVVKQGSDITVIAYGAMVRECQKAAELSHTSIEIIDVRTLKPLDKETIIKSVGKTGRCVVVHEAPRTCGFGAELVSIIQEHTLLSLKAPIERVTGYDVVMPLPKMENYYLPNAERIAAAIERVMKF